jgi:spermidine/putrescine transport system ATP-binding protein
VLLDGADISAMPINRRPFNTVFQDYALFPHMTVEANVAYGLKVRGVGRSEIRRKVAETLGLVSLDGFGGRYPAQLSGGQQQRVALARAIICAPRLILLDEPLGALDAELRRQMQRFLKQLQREIRTTFLFVTHDQEEAVTIADRICVMQSGRIEQIGSPQDVYYRPANEYVARFFGDNNLLDATIGGFDDGAISVTSPVGTFRCAANRPAAGGGRSGKLLVRPEAIAFGEGAGNPNRLRVRVEEANFVGPVSQVRVSATARPDVTLMIKLPSRAAGLPVAVGSDTEVSWSERECHFVAT